MRTMKVRQASITAESADSASPEDEANAHFFTAKAQRREGRKERQNPDLQRTLPLSFAALCAFVPLR